MYVELSQDAGGRGEFLYALWLTTPNSGFFMSLVKEISAWHVQGIPLSQSSSQVTLIKFSWKKVTPIYFLFPCLNPPRLYLG
jgi:hypothetical protein